MLQLGLGLSLGRGAGGAPPSTLWTPVLNAALAEWLDSTAVANGTVASITSKDATAVALAATGTINKSAAGFALTGTQYFSRSAPAVVSLKYCRYPDLSASTAGRGFTCTGLSRLANGDMLASNHGYARPADVGVIAAAPSLYRFTYDEAANNMTPVGETLLQPLYANSYTSAQGNAIDYRTNNWFVTDENNMKVRCVSPAGWPGRLAIRRYFRPDTLTRILPHWHRTKR